jgi:outer membrane protein
MNKKFFFSMMLMVFGFFSQAQKIAIIDISKIMDAVPEYKTANEELEKISNKWRQEIAQENDKLKGLFNKYQAEQVLLNEEQKKQKEEEIMAKEKEIRDLQRDKFGPEGALFKKRSELVKPIQDKVYSAITRYAESRGFDFMFDKGGSAGLIYNNPTFDKTDDLIKEVSKK